MIQKNNSLSPFDFDDLKNVVPEIKDCGSDVQHISLDNPIDSSNMNIKNWKNLRACKKKVYRIKKKLKIIKMKHQP